MGWYSRYILSWELSNTLDSRFCGKLQGKALIWTSRPEIFNTDQGVQFGSREFTGLLQDCEIKISMDGRGRVYDNIFVERLWRAVKYEEVYLHEYRTVSEARQGLGNYFLFYNMERLHQSLSYRTPSEEVYFGGLKAIYLRLRQGHEMVKISRNRQAKSAPYTSPLSVQTTGSTSW